MNSGWLTDNDAGHGRCHPILSLVVLRQEDIESSRHIEHCYHGHRAADEHHIRS